MILSRCWRGTLTQGCVDDDDDGGLTTMMMIWWGPCGVDDSGVDHSCSGSLVRIITVRQDVVCVGGCSGVFVS